MSAQRRIALLVCAIAVAAVAVVAVAVVSSDGSSGETTARANTAPKPRAGRPPLSFAMGFRTDPEARDLLKGQALYARGEIGAAAALFAKHDSLEGKVGAALAGWPEGSLDRLEQLAKLYPEAAVVQLHLGLARFWANEGDPTAAWRSVVEAEPDTPYAVVAGNLLHPNLPRGLPAFIPSFSAPAGITKLPPARQLEALRVAAAHGGLREQLLYGVGLQRVGRPAGIPATRRRRSPAPWGSSTRTLPSARSVDSAHSRVRTPTSPRFGSISASCFCGRDGSTRRSASSGWRRRRGPARHSPGRLSATSRRSVPPALETALTTAALVTTL